MTIAACDIASDIDPLTSIDGPEQFEAIGHTGIDGVVWRRALPDGFRSWMDGLPKTVLPSARVVTPTPDVGRVVQQIVENSGMPTCDLRRWFAKDVSDIASAFANAMSAPFLRLRFDVVTDDACRKFHRDAVTARLLCTYRGSGTQYGVMHDGDRPDTIFSAPLGAPILLCGTLWPSVEGMALRHRSPPISGSHVPRLILAIDPLAAHPEMENCDDELCCGR